MTLPARNMQDVSPFSADADFKTDNEIAPSPASEGEAEKPRLVPVNVNNSVSDSAGDAPQIKTGSEPEAGTSTLFPPSELERLQERWDQIQTAFVDQPREAVHDADRLVSSAIQQLAEGFTAERSKLEQRWGRDESASTEDLRVALQRYRSFFRRILSV
jgi:hypothetical protein